MLKHWLVTTLKLKRKSKKTTREAFKSSLQFQSHLDVPKTFVSLQVKRHASKRQRKSLKSVSMLLKHVHKMKNLCLYLVHPIKLLQKFWIRKVIKSKSWKLLTRSLTLILIRIESDSWQTQLSDKLRLMQFKSL